MSEEKTAKESIEEMNRAIEYLNKLGIVNPGVTQVEKYFKFKKGYYQAGESKIQNIRGKIGLLKDLGMEEQAKKILHQYHRIKSGEGKNVIPLNENNRFPDQVWEVFNVLNSKIDNLDKFNSLAEKVEQLFADVEKRAFLKAYYLTQEPEFGEININVTETSIKEIPSRYVGCINRDFPSIEYYTNPKEEVHEEKWNFSVKEARDILQGLYHLKFKVAPEQLRYLQKGITKGSWKKAYGLARAVQNEREECEKFKPKIKDFDRYRR
jgi:hypothetical protein